MNRTTLTRQLSRGLLNAAIPIVALSFVVGCVATMPTSQEPIDQRQLTREVQTMLAAKGFDPGPADGVAGSKTYAALSEYQRSRGLPITNGVTSEAYRQLAEDRQRSQPASAPQPVLNRGEQEEAKRRALSRNDARVTFRAHCPGLYIPEVYKKRYQGLIPVYAMRVLNNSNKRYAVKYDLVYTEAQHNVLGKYGGQFKDEKHFSVRPGTYTEFLLIEENNKSTGSRVTGIAAIDVFECRGS